MDAFAQFEGKWLPVLASGAKLCFRWGACQAEDFLHTAKADRFVAEQGLEAIGYNWELLDAGADEKQPRSALGEIVKALSHDLSNPSKPWLDREVARQCAGDFLALFNPRERTIVANRYDGLWNPISGQEVEWGFVGFDEENIALLLLAER